MSHCFLIVGEFRFYWPCETFGPSMKAKLYKIHTSALLSERGHCIDLFSCIYSPIRSVHSGSFHPTFKAKCVKEDEFLSVRDAVKRRGQTILNNGNDAHTHSLAAPTLFLHCSLPRVNMFPWKQSAQDWPSLEVVGLHREGEGWGGRDGGMLDNKRRRAAWKCALMMLSKMSESNKFRVHWKHPNTIRFTGAQHCDLRVLRAWHDSSAVLMLLWQQGCFAKLRVWC